MSNIDNLQNIMLTDDMNFTDLLFILQEFLFTHNILDNENILMLETYSEKIYKLKNFSCYNKDTIFLLLYLSIMLYNDLCDPRIINKIKQNEFIKLFNTIDDKLSYDLLENIYNNINDNIKNNILHDKKIITYKKSCIIL